MYFIEQLHKSSEMSTILVGELLRGHINTLFFINKTPSHWSYCNLIPFNQSTLFNEGNTGQYFNWITSGPQTKIIKQN